MNQSLNKLIQIMNGTMGIYHDFAAKMGMSDSVLAILYTVCTSGERCCLSEIARCNGLSKQTVNSAIRKLERQNIVLLERGRGRNCYVRLTETGEKYVREHVEPIIRAEEEVLDGWPDADRRMHLELMERYRADMERKYKSL
ncbi:MAG: MarR family transcriptional regulator [Clostridia bacterium]|nr:MarR family transcriptional regulator [Clostridia bacterium]